MNYKSVSSEKKGSLSKNTIVIVISLLVGAISISVRAFYSNSDKFIPFLCCVIPIVSVITLVYAVTRIENENIYVFIPYFINVATFLILVFVPWQNIEFNNNFEGYSEVIELIKEGEIKVNKTTNMAILPEKYQHLSNCNGGEIMVDKPDGVLEVLFFSYCGFLGECSGTMYRTDDKPPGINRWDEITKLKEHWYYCVDN